MNRIKDLRDALNMTQREFAERMGTATSTIGNYEVGAREPSNQMLLSVCREFNVREEWLRNGEGEMFIPQEDDLIARAIRDHGGGLSDEYIAFLDFFIEMTPEQQKVVLEFTKMIKEKTIKDYLASMQGAEEL